MSQLSVDPILLYEFLFDPGFGNPTVTGFEKSLSADSASLCVDLQYLYGIVFFREKGSAVIPLGGFLAKSNMSAKAEGFISHLAVAAAQTSSLMPILREPLFKVVPMRYEIDRVPSFSELERIAGDLYYVVGSVGNA